MRIKNSIYNSITSVFLSILKIIIGLVVNKIFLNVLGPEYLGINGLFTNIISMLAIVELGIGSAIIFNLYEPIAKAKIEEIKSLMDFYKKCYRNIAIVVTIIGIMIIPFLKYIIKNNTLDSNVNIIYLMFLTESVASYLLSYKRSILYANQKNYIINIVDLFYVIIMNSLSLMILCRFKNYYLFLGIKILMRILENIVISKIANIKYEYLKEKNIKKIDKKVYLDIVKKVKALIIHKVSGFLVLGTDNIIISSFLGLIQVGLVSNYLIIISACGTIIGQIISSLTASVGNLLVLDKNKSYEVYKKIYFMNYILATIFSIGILLVINDFIKIWIGQEYLLSIYIVIVLVIKFYYEQIRATSNIFKEAAGIYYEDRFVPLVESITNIVLSIILVRVFGIAGVFIGTIISTLILHLYSYPKYVFIKLFNKTYKEYIKMFLKYSLVTLFIGVISFSISNCIVFTNNILNLLIHGIIAILVSAIILVLIFNKTDEYKYFKDLIIIILKNFQNKYKIIR